MRNASQSVVALALMVALVVPQFVRAAESSPVGTVAITNPSNGAELNGLYEFDATFTDANASTTNSAKYTIYGGTCASEGAMIEEGTMFNTDGSLAVTRDLSTYDNGDYCFRATVLGIAEIGETDATDSVDFSVITPSSVKIMSPHSGQQVNGEVNFAASVTFGSPELTNDIEWSIKTGSCESEDGVQVAGNTNGFDTFFLYQDGVFASVLDTTSWDKTDYCFEVNPVDAGESNIYAMVDFTIALNHVYGLKYEDVDGNNLLDYETDRLVAGMPIIATNNETDEVVATTTDSEGNFSFDLPNGIWTISEGEKAGWEEIRAYYGQVLSDKGDDEVVPMSCVLELNINSKNKFKSLFNPNNGCTFLNKQVPLTKHHSSGGTLVRPRTTPVGQVLGIATTTVGTTTATGTTPKCEGKYLTSYMRMSTENPVEQVVKLQVFLNTLGFTVAVTGKFDETTDKVVRAFQEKYLVNVLTPWKIAVGTGYVFKTTRATINNMVCPGSEVVPQI
jgi:Putative peptidoglycan binding domain